MRSTDENEQSSRSHLIYSIKIVKKPRNGDKEVVGKITFIDLAGSESPARVGVDREIYNETLSINLSLAHIGNVIEQLAAGKSRQEIDFDVHALTKSMRDSLGGDAKTLMVVNISPSKYNLDQTRDTLCFARKTGLISNREGQLFNKAVHYHIVRH